MLELNIFPSKRFQEKNARMAHLVEKKNSEKFPSQTLFHFSIKLKAKTQRPKKKKKIEKNNAPK